MQNQFQAKYTVIPKIENPLEYKSQDDRLNEIEYRILYMENTTETIINNIDTMKHDFDIVLNKIIRGQFNILFCSFFNKFKFRNCQFL